ncbi:MAG: serine protease MucD [Gammaproteobacteria bacterium]|nr:MAG: serine protease MucD [Gammaproteobacteria bacterium]
MMRINIARNIGTIVLLFVLGAVADVYASGLPDFVALAEKNGPAVVNISTTQKILRSRPQFNIPDLPENSPFNDFFEKFFGENNNMPREFDSKSLGSGFIISSDGYIITNNHVIKDADEIIVRLGDRREVPAKVVGADERSDIALLKVDAKGLPVVKIGNAESLKVGEWVLAIGSPFGFDHSVTAGIVSAKGRNLPSENYVPFIQTDVAINPGNSGGPLFNLDGEVIGVNSQIYSRTGGFMGLSFAIPIEVAMDVVNQLKTKGHVSRGWLGVLIQDVTRELAESFGMDKPHGALVSRVLPDSPAADAGFKIGDVIVNYNGSMIDRSGDLPPVVGRTAIGKKVPVKVIRNGKRVTLKVKIGELPGEDELKVASSSGSATDNQLNIQVTNLTAEMRSKLGVQNHGVLVKTVKSGAAFDAGIRKGDVILRLNNTKVKNTGHFTEIVKGLPKNKSVPVLVQRRGGPIFLALKVKDGKK